MKFKTPQIETEYNALVQQNHRLGSVLLALEVYCAVEFKTDLTITHIKRSPEEHAALYAATPPEKRPATSPHLTWEAADIRSSVFTPEQKQKMLKFLNCFTYRGGKPTAILHAISGNVEHFHIQVANA